MSGCKLLSSPNKQTSVLSTNGKFVRKFLEGHTINESKYSPNNKLTNIINIPYCQLTAL